MRREDRTFDTLPGAETRVPYTCALFDVGETLIGPAGSFGTLYARVLRARGLDADPDRCETSLRRSAREMDAALPTGADRYSHFPGGEKAYWARFATRTVSHATGRTLDAEEALEILGELRATFRRREAWRVFEDVRPTLTALREADVRCAVVSNWDTRLRDVLALNELLTPFEAVVVSAELGVEKPDPRIFGAALHALSIAPAEALHVGDRIDTDVEGARAAGIDALWIDRKNRPPVPGVERIVDLREMVERFDR